MTSSPTIPSLNHVEQVNPLRSPTWDEDLKRFPEATYFHTSHWAKVLCSTYGFVPEFLKTTVDGQLEALMPLMAVSSALTGKRGVSLPFTDECAPLIRNQKAFLPIWRHALDLGMRHGWRYLETRGEAGLLTDATPSTSFFGHRVNLMLDEKKLFSSFDSSVRRAIRKSERSGLSIEMSNSLEAVKSYYLLHCQTRKFHGLPPQSFGFFRNLHAEALENGHGKILLANYEGRAVAGAVFLSYGRIVVFKYGASNRDFLHLRPNNLIMWEAMRHHSRLGYEILDFGRTSTWNEGLRSFKLHWGTTERTIHYHRYNFSAGEFGIKKDMAAGLHVQMVKHLPVWLARMAGALLYQHIA